MIQTLAAGCRSATAPRARWVMAPAPGGVPRVAESPAVFECRLHSTLAMGDCVLVFGEVTHAAVSVEVLDGIGTGLQSVAVPGMVTRSLYGTGRVNLAQGAVITVQGIGAAFSPALGGWIAHGLGYAPTFLVLGGLGLLATLVWIVLGAAVKEY